MGREGNRGGGGTLLQKGVSEGGEKEKERTQEQRPYIREMMHSVLNL